MNSINFAPAASATPAVLPPVRKFLPRGTASLKAAGTAIQRPARKMRDSVYNWWNAPTALFFPGSLSRMGSK
jgi:hypothetical protein